MFRRAATQLAAASAVRVASAAATGASSSSLSSSSSAALPSLSAAGIGSIARSFASTTSSSSSPAAASAVPSRARPLPTLAWAAATALATTSLLAPSSGSSAARAEEAAAAEVASSSTTSPSSTTAETLYSLPEATGLFSSSNTSSPLTLFQYEVCPFCCKVKAVLDFYNVPYRVVEVSPLTKRQLKWGQHRKVPVLALGGVEEKGAGASGGKEAFAPLPGVDVLADSSLIISRIAAEAEAAGLGPENGKNKNKSKSKNMKQSSSSSWFRRRSNSSSSSSSLSSSPPVSKEATWRKWVDGRLVKVITVNIYRTAGESWQAFDYISRAGDFGSSSVEKTAARVVGAGMMYAIAGRLAKRYGVVGEPRQALEQAGREWTEGALRREEGEEGEGDGESSDSSSSLAAPFAGGDSPDLADLSAFGVWRAVRDTDSFRDAMGGNAELRGWYGRVERAVGASSRVE